VNGLYRVGPAVVELDLTEECVQVGGGERLLHLCGLRRGCPLGRDLEREAGGGRGGGILVGHVAELRGERQCVMETIEEITDPVAGGWCPLRRSDREVRRLVEVGGEQAPTRPIT